MKYKTNANVLHIKQSITSSHCNAKFSEVPADQKARSWGQR